jgi:mannose-1-phosphate guanylyltransferase/phosphomannomutase
MLRQIDMSGVREAGLKVVADCAGGTASLVLPGLLGRIGVDVLTVNSLLDERAPVHTLAQTRAGLQRLADLVSSSRADFGVRFDPVGERLTLVDDKGALVSDARALLVVLDGPPCRSPPPGWPSRSAGSTGSGSTGPRPPCTRFTRRPRATT